MFVRMDSDKDGIVSKEEAKLEIKNQMQQQQQQQQGGAPPGGAPQGGQVNCHCHCTLLLLQPSFRCCSLLLLLHCEPGHRLAHLLTPCVAMSCLLLMQERFPTGGQQPGHGHREF